MLAPNASTNSRKAHLAYRVETFLVIESTGRFLKLAMKIILQDYAYHVQENAFIATPNPHQFEDS